MPMTGSYIKKLIAISFAVIGLTGFVFIIWKTHQFSKRIERGEITDPLLIKSHGKAKLIPWYWAFTWFIFTIMMWN
jgi:hypothetical protein